MRARVFTACALVAACGGERRAPAPGLPTTVGSDGGDAAGGALGVASDVADVPDVASDGCGTPTADPPITSHGGVAGLGHHLYWFAGTDGAPTTRARRFDVRTRRWETLPEPDGARIHPAVVAAGGALYVIGGVSGSFLGMSDIHRFDPAACEWRHVGALPWAPGSAQATAVGDRIVVAGGRIDNRAGSLYTLEIWSSDQSAVLDTSGTILPLSPLAQARNDGAAVTVGDAAWVLGGNVVPKGVDTIGRGTDDVEILAAGATTWTAGPSLPFSAEVFAVALPDRTVVAFGRGVLESRAPAILDPGKTTWRTGQKRDAKLEFLEGAAVIDGVIYLLGNEITGGLSNPAPDIYRVATYDPRTDRWTIVNEVVADG